LLSSRNVIRNLPQEALPLLQAPPQRLDEPLVALPPFGLRRRLRIVWQGRRDRQPKAHEQGERLCGDAEIALKALIDALAAATIPTGCVQTYLGLTAPSGWLLCAGTTIGDGSSGASERANADCESLFLLLWASMADAQAPVSGGRGASAAADWSAHKRITLPDLRGRAVAGLDADIGGVSGLLTSITATTMGNSGGAETVTLTSSSTPAHSHTGSLDTGGAHTHTFSDIGSGYTSGATATRTVSGSTQIYSSTSTDGAHTHTLTLPSSATATAHNNVQPSLLMGWGIKLCHTPSLRSDSQGRR
jgi:microcystin-dependent protein